MTPRTAGLSPQMRARLAGWLYLSLVPLGLVSALILPGNATATVNHILASESLLRLSIVIALVTQIINILIVLVLYQVLKPANKNMAVLMVIFYLVAVPITMLNELNRLAILILVHNPTGLTADQMQVLVSLFLHLHANGTTIAYIFYGLWLFPMGYLVFTSRFLPRILGVLLVVSGLGYLSQSFIVLLFPTFGVPVGLLTAWGEVIFPLWLVIRGVNVVRWENRAGASTADHLSVAHSTHGGNG